jgi:glutamyl-tRNA synthetase
MEMSPRFRFAPSPTGIPHIGNLHTALFSWALARAMGGDFIIRIEDTDQVRNVPETTDLMLDALSWLGIDWDEGPDIGGEFAPYFQSQRLTSHQQAITRLLDSDTAYFGDDPDRPATRVGNPLRLRMPGTGQTILHDAIRGPISFDNEGQKDPIIVRSDGRSLYHLAAMVDDHDMAITHVVRADEWIASSPIHVRLYQALGWKEPVWIHLPLILNKKGQKLKKRDPEGGYQIRDFQAAGYLSEAVFNYLLLLGWAPDNAQEIISRRDVRRQLRIERLSASPAIFDWAKLDWVNRQHIRKLSDASLGEHIRPYLEQDYDSIAISDEWLVRLTIVIREKLTRLEDASELCAWAFADEFEYSASGRNSLDSESAKPVLTTLIAEIASIVLLDEHTARSIVGGLRSRFNESHGWAARNVLQPIRVALTGHTSGPPVHEIMGIIGKERTLNRLAMALRK